LGESQFVCRERRSIRYAVLGCQFRWHQPLDGVASLGSYCRHVLIFSCHFFVVGRTFRNLILVLLNGLSDLFNQCRANLQLIHGSITVRDSIY
jgi:hypothetical protein